MSRKYRHASSFFFPSKEVHFSSFHIPSAVALEILSDNTAGVVVSHHWNFLRYQTRLIKAIKISFERVRGGRGNESESLSEISLLYGSERVQIDRDLFAAVKLPSLLLSPSVASIQDREVVNLAHELTLAVTYTRDTIQFVRENQIPNFIDATDRADKHTNFIYIILLSILLIYIYIYIYYTNIIYIF